MTEREEAIKIVTYYLGDKVSEDRLTEEVCKEILEEEKNCMKNAKDFVDSCDNIKAEHVPEAYIDMYQSDMYYFLYDYFFPKFD